MMRYRYIAIEGVDGAGKSTQIALLSERLSRCDLTPIAIFEPTYGRYGRLMREHMTRGDVISVDRQIEIFTLDRKEHVSTRVRPLLDLADKHRHFVILQHRYYLSAPAYQAEEPDAMSALLQQQQMIAPRPDIVFLIDVPVDLAVKRLIQREGESANRLFERRTFLEGVRDRYLYLARMSGEPIRVIDGTGSGSEVCERIWQSLDLAPVVEKEAEHEA